MTIRKKSDNDLVSRTILISRYHKKYLDEHSEINLSGFVRRKIDEAIALEEGK